MLLEKAFVVLVSLVGFCAVGRGAPAGELVTREGVVTAVSIHEGFLYLRDDAQRPWRAEFGREQFPKDAVAGDRLTLTGLVFTATDPRPRVRHAGVTGRRPGGERPKPVAVDLADVGRHPVTDKGATDWWGERVKVRGTITDINRRDRWAQVLLKDGKGGLLQVHFYQPYDQPLDSDFRIGVELSVVGNALYTPMLQPWTRQIESINNPQVFVESCDDIEILTHAPWWTPQKFVIALTLLTLCLAVAVLWALLQRYKRQEDRLLADALGRERLRLAGELHDNFQQLLAGCMFRLGAAMQLADEDNASELEQLEKLGDLLTHAQNDLRAALWGMREEAEGPTALSALLKYAADRMPHWSGKVRFTTVGTERPLTRRYSGALLLLLQEAVGNALRHARPTRIDVTVTFDRRFVALSVKDDGVGFDVNRAMDGESQGLGILSMRSRVEGVGGGFRIVSAPGRGTEVKVKVRL